MEFSQSNNSQPPVITQQKGGTLYIDYPYSSNCSLPVRPFVDFGIQKWATSIQLPAWSKQSCIIEYLSNVKEHILKQLSQLRSNFWMRRLFVTLFTQHFPQRLEIDSSNYLFSSVVMSKGSFSFVVIISLSENWPQTPPSIYLNALSHFNPNGTPISRVSKDFPYSPRWDPQTMSNRLFHHLSVLEVEFHKICSKVDSQRE